MSDIYNYSRVYRDLHNGGGAMQVTLQVAVVYAPGHGAEWSATEALVGNTDLAKLLMFHPDIVRYVQDTPVQQRTESDIKAVLDRIGVTDYVYCGAVDDLRIKWVDEGTCFRIRHYDGNEWIEVLDPSNFITA
jgi:hypothetical protein